MVFLLVHYSLCFNRSYYWSVFREDDFGSKSWDFRWKKGVLGFIWQERVKICYQFSIAFCAVISRLFHGYEYNHPLSFVVFIGCFFALRNQNNLYTIKLQKRLFIIKKRFIIILILLQILKKAPMGPFYFLAEKWSQPIFSRLISSPFERIILFVFLEDVTFTYNC